MKKLIFAILISGMFATNVNAYDISALGDIQAPKDFKNIVAVPAGTDKNASAYVIFIKQHVKAHYHVNHTELVYVLSGEANFTLNGTLSKVKAGDFIRIAPTQIHSVIVTSKEPLKVLSIQTPEFKGKDRIYID